jgi:enoyl-CoA hydratase/carnithine racemase
MSDTVLLTIDGPRATITLNDPAKHNRLDPAGLGRLRAAIEKADANPNVRVTVLTGAGEKTFCSGYDLGSIPSGKSAKPSSETERDSFETVMDRLEAMRMPTLCALNGGVYGGATDMALACDFRMGVKGMKFFMPAARFGLHYYPSGLRRYTQKVSPSFAKRAFLLSEDFSDEDLLRVGYRRGRDPAGRPGAALHVQHEARDRAVRPGRTGHPEDSRRHSSVPDLGRSA